MLFHEQIVSGLAKIHNILSFVKVHVLPFS